MARFSIYSKDGSSVLYSGTPTYNGTYMKPAYLEFREIAVDAPINWQVGDYVDYTRTGLRYKLYFIPQPTKNARSGQSGKAFVYQNVQFYAETKKLEIALFRDLVPVDNQIHFSTQQAISVYDNVEGIAERLQACMDEYDPNNWLFQVIDYATGLDFSSDDFSNDYARSVAGADYGGASSAAKDYNKDYRIQSYQALISEDREFTMSNGTILDALQQIYDTWEEIGWAYSVKTINGSTKNVITIGKPLFNVKELQTNIFQYGKGMGLKTIKKSQANKDEMATRLYVYGSNKNMYPGYYRGKEILDADSVDIQNLMLPIAKWGTTYDEEESEYLPDAKKAYVEDTTAKTKYGLIPKSIYFDGGDNEEIYPSIKKTTIGEIRAGIAAITDPDERAKYKSPSTSIYTNDDERVDVIKAAVNPSDDGTQTSSGSQYTDVVTSTFQGESIYTQFVAGTDDDILSKQSETGEIGSVTSGSYNSDLVIAEGSASGTLSASAEVWSTLTMVVIVGDKEVCSKVILSGVNNTGSTPVSFSTPEIKLSEIEEDSEICFKFRLSTRHKQTSATTQLSTLTVNGGTATYSFYHSLPPSFSLTLKQIGFSIGDRAALGDGKTIHMLDGDCAGRSFVVKKVLYQSATDDWFLQMYRGYDEDLAMYFPNTTYPISAGDHFVLLDIAMPELYITMAANKLYQKGLETLQSTARIEPYYEPEIDAIQMVRNLEEHAGDEEYILREGKYFILYDEQVTDDDTQFILVDTLTINEGESAIPTYKVTLREKKKVSFQQSTANTIKTLEQKVVDSSGTLKSVNTASTDYNDLDNKPSINSVELLGDMSSIDLGIVTKSGTYINGNVLVCDGTNGMAKAVSPSTLTLGTADAIKDQTSSSGYQVAIVTSMPSTPSANTIYILI